MLSQILVTNKILATNEFGSIESGDKLIRIYRKLSKTRKLLKSGNLKCKKLSKSQKLAKLGKKLSKSGNSPNFNIKKNRPSFLIPDTKMVFNHL